jgi:hypothetical protein
MTKKSAKPAKMTFNLGADFSGALRAYVERCQTGDLRIHGDHVVRAAIRLFWGQPSETQRDLLIREKGIRSSANPPDDIGESDPQAES